MQNFRHEYTDNETVLRVWVRGVVGHENVGELEEIILQGIDRGCDGVVIDLRSSEFLPSICFGVLLACGEQALERNLRIKALMHEHHAKLARSIGVAQVVDIEVD